MDDEWKKKKKQGFGEVSNGKMLSELDFRPRFASFKKKSVDSGSQEKSQRSSSVESSDIGDSKTGEESSRELRQRKSFKKKRTTDATERIKNPSRKRRSSRKTATKENAKGSKHRTSRKVKGRSDPPLESEGSRDDTVPSCKSQKREEINATTGPLGIDERDNEEEVRRKKSAKQTEVEVTRGRSRSKEKRRRSAKQQSDENIDGKVQERDQKQQISEQQTNIGEKKSTVMGESGKRRRRKSAREDAGSVTNPSATGMSPKSNIPEATMPEDEPRQKHRSKFRREAPDDERHISTDAKLPMGDSAQVSEKHLKALRLQQRKDDLKDAKARLTKEEYALYKAKVIADAKAAKKVPAVKAEAAQAPDGSKEPKLLEKESQHKTFKSRKKGKEPRTTEKRDSTEENKLKEDQTEAEATADKIRKRLAKAKADMSEEEYTAFKKAYLKRQALKLKQKKEASGQQEGESSPHTGELADLLAEAKAADLSAIENCNIFYKCQGRMQQNQRKIFVFDATRIPADGSLDLDALFLFVLRVLDAGVAHGRGYEVVYIDCEMKSRPPISWFQKIYAVLERRYKKNIKQLYLVDASFWLKSMVRLMSPWISIRFWNKLVYVYDRKEMVKLQPMLRTEPSFA